MGKLYSLTSKQQYPQQSFQGSQWFQSHLKLLIGLALCGVLLVSCGTVTNEQTTPSVVPPIKNQITPVAKTVEQNELLNLGDLNYLKQDSVKVVVEAEGTVTQIPKLRPLFVGSSKVEMRLLIISAAGNPTVRDSSDPTLDGISYFAEQIGIPYDIMIATSEQLTESRLIAANGDGRYQAIILTDSGLSFNNAGVFESAFDQAEWNLLWQYEREFNVRQLSMTGFPGGFPEDLGLRETSSVSPTVETPLNVKISTEGQAIFGSLKDSAIIPVTNAFTNLASVCSENPALACPVGVTTTPILRTAVSNQVVAALSKTADNREIITLTMGHNFFLTHTSLLSYDLLKWVTQGVFIGGRQMSLQMDIDDWYQASLVWDPATNANGINPDGSAKIFELRGDDVLAARDQLNNLRSRFPVAADINYSNAIVGFKGDGNATVSCAPGSSLSAATLCVKDVFDWVSHTYTERIMNFESPGYNNAADEFYTTIDPELNGNFNGFNCDDTNIAGFSPTSIAEEIVLKELVCNIQKLQQIGIPFNPNSVITSAHSGLGHYNPDPLNPAFIDNGLQNSSSGTLRAMTSAGIRYMGSNHSVLSHRGICEVCGRQHPDFPQIFLIPRYPTFIFFNATQPSEIQSEFNFLFGPTGQFVDGFGNAFFDRDLNYDEIIKLDAQVTLRHISSLQPYMHFFHQANLKEYTPGRSLVYDWAEAFLELYSSFYDLPLLTLDWTDQAINIEQRTSFFESDVTGVWDRAAGEVTVTSLNGGWVYLTNAGFSNVDTSPYGSDVIQKFQLAAGASRSGSTVIIPTPVTPIDPINPTTPTTPVTPVIPPTPSGPNLLVNGSFENNQAAWSTCGTGQTTIVTDATNGNAAINLTGLNANGACLFQEVDVVAGSTYSLTCDAKRNNNNEWSSLTLNFSNSDYSTEVPGALKEIVGSSYVANTLTAIAPANAARASVVLYSEDSASIDNCVLSGEAFVPSTPIPNPAPTTNPANNVLSNGSFENSLNNWFACDGISSIVNDAASGTKAVQLAGAADACLYQEVPVNAGQSLSLSCTAKRNQTSGYSGLSVSVNDVTYTTSLANQDIEIIGSAYQNYSLNLVVPIGGTSAAVTMYSEDSATYDDCVLNIR